jgi:hypothetical protein
MKMTLGIFADIEDLDARDFLRKLAEASGRASAVITMTPGQIGLLQFWFYASRYASIWVRFNWGYGRRGTLPLPGTKESEQFFAAISQIYRYANWLEGVIIGNEPNNPQEWPDGKALDPEGVASCVHWVWRRAPASLRIGPPPVDLFNAVAGNPYDYLDKMARRLNLSGTRPEFLTVQLKTQTSASPLVQEQYLFTDPPLTGKSMNLGASIEALRLLYRHLSTGILVVPEMNPQRKTTSPAFRPDDRDYGWTGDSLAATGWVLTTIQILQVALRAFPIREVYLHVYRWARDEWAIKQREDIKDGLIQIAKLAHRA